MKHDAKMHNERMPPAGDLGDRDPPGRSGVRDILRLRRALPRSGGPIAAGRDPQVCVGVKKVVEIRISMPDVKITDKDLIEMVSHGAVCKPDGSKVTLEDLERAGIKW